MKKGKYILIALLIISILFSFITYMNQKQNTKLADQIFTSSLSSATSGFAQDYSKINEDDKIFHYLEITSNLNTAMDTLDLTSYNKIKNRNELFQAIYSLYWCMTRKDSRDKILSNNNMTTIFNCLSKIARNPEDEKDCQTLSKLAGDLYSNSGK